MCSFQLPHRQHGPHYRRKQEQPAVRVRPGEHHLPRLPARQPGDNDARRGGRRRRGGTVHHLQRTCSSLL